MWRGNWKINYSHPCAQAYINSIANKFASWGIDLLKIDGVDADNVPDVLAWSQALIQTGRPIWLTVSAWPVPLSIADQVNDYGNGIRIDTDVECYCNTVATWTNSVDDRWNDLPSWLGYVGPGNWADLDSMPIGNNTGQGIQDGLNNNERVAVMVFWSMASSPLYVGSDLYFLDSFAQALLTNPEIIDVDQAARLPTRITSGTLQKWKKTMPDGSQAVAVYNLGSSSANITVNWSELGISGNATVRDLVSRTNLGTFNGSWTANNVPAHGARLIKVVGSGGGTTDKVQITNTDSRTISNLKVTVTFTINGARHYDYENQGTFDKTINDGLNATGGTWNASANRWEGNFLYVQSSAAGSKVFTINKVDTRSITNLRIEVNFDINGAPHYDYHDVGNFAGTISLILNASGGTWDGSKWVGDFLHP
jgi:hypothetical protein